MGVERAAGCRTEKTPSHVAWIGAYAYKCTYTHPCVRERILNVHARLLSHWPKSMMLSISFVDLMYFAPVRDTANDCTSVLLLSRLLNSSPLPPPPPPPPPPSSSPIVRYDGNRCACVREVRMK